MTEIEAPKLTRKQERSLRDKQKRYGTPDMSPEHWEIVVQDLDEDIQERGFVVCRFDIENMLIAITSNSWYGNVIYSVSEKEAVTLDDIKDYYIKESIRRNNFSEKEARLRMPMDSVEQAVEFMRVSGLINKSPEDQYKLSNATLRYWDIFAEAHDFWKKERPPAPILKQTGQ